MNSSTETPLTTTFRIYSAIVDSSTRRRRVPASPEKLDLGQQWEFIPESETPINVGPLGAFWCYLRGLDKQGSGIVQFNLSDVAAAIKKSVGSIRRWLQKSEARIFFRAIEIVNGRCKIVYRSLFQVCVRLGIDSPGACIEAEASEFHGLTELATQAEAQLLQQQSSWQAMKQHKSAVVFPEVVLAPCQSMGSRKPKKHDSANRRVQGSILFRGERCTFVSSDFITFGASQAGIGKRTNRSDRTVRARLSNSRRDRKGLTPLNRRQLAKQVPTGFDFEYDDVDLNGKTIDSNRLFHIRKRGKISRSFILLNNIYDRELALIGIHRFRKKLKDGFDRATWNYEQELIRSNDQLVSVQSNQFDQSPAFEPSLIASIC